MDIQMYNVQFGDCFLVRDQIENLLIDFGSDSPGVLGGVADELVRNNGGKQLSVLITHFHKDHINGFWKTNFPSKITVSDIYIPDIFNMKNVGGKLTVPQLVVLEDIFDAIVLQSVPEITLYSLLLSMLNWNANIHFVQRGSSFDISGKKYFVLWPDIDSVYIHRKVESKVIALLNKIGIMGTEQYEVSEEINRYEYEQGPISLGAIDDFIEALQLGYLQLQQERAIDWQTMHRIESVYDIVSEDIRNLGMSVSRQIRAEIKAERSSMRAQANKMSVVFHDQAIDGASRILMTGDILSSDLYRLIVRWDAPVIQPNYQVIKAPHHGTGSHFVNCLPACKEILVSNGGGNSAYRGKISFSYGSFYGSHKRCEIICSNPRCELLNIPGTVGCANCKKTRVLCQTIVL